MMAPRWHLNLHQRHLFVSEMDEQNLGVRVVHPFVVLGGCCQMLVGDIVASAKILLFEVTPSMVLLMWPVLV